MNPNHRLKTFALAFLTAALIGMAWFVESKAKTVFMVLSPEEAESLCRREKYKLADFWERAKTLGVHPVPAGDDRLSTALRSGQALHLTRAEVEKWRLLGLLAPSAAVRPNSLWFKEADLHRQVRQTAIQSGIIVSSLAVSGFHVLEFSEDLDPGDLSSGNLTDRLKDARALSVGVGSGELMRAIHSRRHAVLRWKLIPALGVEGNLEKIRAASRLTQKHAGLEAADPAAPWSAAAAALIAGLASLAAVRVGLIVLRTSRTWARGRFPEASPIAELAAALAAGAGVAALLGLAVNACGGLPWRAGGEPWWVWAVPLAMGFFALFAGDAPQWKRRMSKPLTMARIFRFSGAVLLAALILKPLVLIDALGAREAFFAILEKAPDFWWLAWRWREPVLGTPALLASFYLLMKKWDCPGCDAADPRPWLLMGLISVAGIHLGLAQGGIPPGEALVQSLIALAGGSLLGGLLIKMRF